MNSFVGPARKFRLHGERVWGDGLQYLNLSLKNKQGRATQWGGRTFQAKGTECVEAPWYKDFGTERKRK